MDIQSIAEFIPKNMTELIVKIMAKNNIQVSQRWSSLLYIFIIFVIFYALIKSESISSIIKIAIFFLFVLLVGGTILPTW